MAANVKTFGGAISEARKAKGWALKDLASRVLREMSIGAQICPPIGVQF